MNHAFDDVPAVVSTPDREFTDVFIRAYNELRCQPFPEGGADEEVEDLLLELDRLAWSVREVVVHWISFNRAHYSVLDVLGELADVRASAVEISGDAEPDIQTQVQSVMRFADVLERAYSAYLHSANPQPPQYTCPVCDHRTLDVKPYKTWPPPEGIVLKPPYADQLGRASYEVCVRCSFEFGNDDDPGTAAPLSFEEYRDDWEARGRPWASPMYERGYAARSSTNDT